MRTYLLTVFLAGLSLVLAGPAPWPFAEPADLANRHHDEHKCITDAKAKELVTKLENIYHCLDPALAKATLTVDFKSYSYSLLRNSTETFEVGNNLYASSRADFIQKQLAIKSETCSLPPFHTFKVFNGCDIVGFWWSLRSGPGTDPPFALTGLDIMVVDVASGKIKADYSEYYP